MPSRRSALGEYDGYSEPAYPEWARSSQYVSMRDGVRLAVDVLRPARDTVAVEDPLPALWTHTRYQRACVMPDGRVRTTVENWNPWLLEVIRHGYAVVVADVRGAGASFGRYEGQYSANECHDAYDVTEWIAAEPWCDGNVGMFGRSYLGITQYFAASEHPPSLRAIFPAMASFDQYSYAYGGGIFREASRFNWQLLCTNLDHSVPTLWNGMYAGPVAPVDEDRDRSLLEAALREHRTNRDWYRMIESLPYRDGIDPASREAIHSTRSAAARRGAIAASGIPIYHLAGWYDMFPRDAALWLRNLPNPQKAVFGPWFHVDADRLDFAAEHLRWFDHWLKGVDNGVMDEDPIHYWTIDAPPGREWRSTPAWPLPDEVRTPCHFDGGPSGSVASVNDGILHLDGAPENEGADAYRVDSATTSGPQNRWANANGGEPGYRDRARDDARALTYTSAPLSAPLEVTGHPVAHLWIETPAQDCDFYVYLEDVAPDGHSRYVTEGALRGSHRALSAAPWDNLGLPFHRGRRADVAPLPDEPVELVFDLHPTSKRFARGHRIRVAIACADLDNDRNVAHDPAPTVTVRRDATHPSRVVLPVIPARAR